MEMDKSFKPTVEWMAEKYDEMNRMLFKGELGPCDFGIFTSGKGSQGGTLGWFKISARGVKIRRMNRRMYRANMLGDEIWVNHDNFVELCKPRIELNGNYSGTEYGFLATLVHEMCHYYTYMDGWAPKQGHGHEFKEIGQIVTMRSNGLFTIQRLASAEQMSELELSDEMKEKRARREANKKSSVTALVVYKNNGAAKLTLTTSERLIYTITDTEEDRSDTVRIFRSNDAELIDTLFANHYSKVMRTWRYWDVSKNPAVMSALNRADGKDIFTREDAQKMEEPKPMAQTPREPTKIFSIKTSRGQVEIKFTSTEQLRQQLRQQFPNMRDEVIEKIMNNPSNYRVVENRRNANSIISEVIGEFIERQVGNDDIEIDPSMNLGLQSPLEGE